MNKIPMGDIVKNAFSATMKAFAAGKVNIRDIVEEAMVNTVIDQKVKQMALQQSETTTEDEPIFLNENNSTDDGK